VEGNSRRAMLLGEQSLLIQCGELLLSQGVELTVVVSKNPVILDWCEQKSVRAVVSYKLLEGEFKSGSLDYVFSITNLQLLPEWLIATGIKAINFHDGPLPRYAGLNAPVWAILNDEVEHGVTWHEMTVNVDEGRVLAQQTFPMVPGETALSINAKCYQAALDSFGSLLSGLLVDELSPVEQDLSQRSYFALNKRPEAAGLIDWTSSAASIERLVRALDHGTYRNPLVTPKFEAGGKLFVIKQAKIHDRDSEYTCGEVTAVSPGYLRVACADGVLELSDIRTLSDEKVGSLEQFSQQNSCSKGTVLHNADQVKRELISERVSHISRYEEGWVEAFRNAEAVNIPYAQSGLDRSGAQDSTWKTIELSLPATALSHAGFTDNPQAFGLSLFSLLLARLNNKNEFTLAAESNEPAEIAGFFEHFLPLSIELDDQQPFSALVSANRQKLTNFEKRGGVAADLWARDPSLAGHGNLKGFAIKLDLDGAQTTEKLAADSSSELYLSLPAGGGAFSLHYNEAKLSSQAVDQLLAQLNVIATDVVVNPDKNLIDISILSQNDKASFAEWNDSAQEYDASQCLHHLIEKQSLERPEDIALAFDEETLSYQKLNQKANQLARLLLEKGAKPDDLIGVMMDRSLDLIVALVAIHKVGCAYVPLDPVYPADRLRYMVEDSGLTILMTEARHKTKLGELTAQLIVHDELSTQIVAYPCDNLDQTIGSDSLAYVIYTSGSTGKPKGVMVEHRNVLNFFVGMDQCIGTQPGVWLAVTSISFDISVLELFWTLARGFKVVIYSEQSALGLSDSSPADTPSVQLKSNIDFSLFYWNVADEESHHQADKYQLLLEGAKFADTHGFKAVWNPERHFASFGGLFPNPSVTCAALATITKNVDLRAGSCVVPLHSPIRVAEEWAVVDNLSNGRVGIAVASGWAPPDFAIKPENHADAKNIMFESLDQVRRLWRGEKVVFPGPTGDVEVRTLPRPIQKELPYWVTTAGNTDTFKRAGEAGANILTHLLGQTFEEVQEKVDAYRQAWKSAGHEGQGTITLMLHTLIGESMEQVEEIVRQPMKSYLKSAMFLVKGAAWNFPTFKKMSEETGKSLDEFFETISDEDMDDLLEFAFQRYFRTSGLFGTPDSAVEIVAKCIESGVDEIACLIDFGIDTQVVMQQLPLLDKLKQNCLARVRNYSAEDSTGDAKTEAYTIPDLIRKHEVTHFQCTPSMATMLVSDPESKPSLQQIQHMMVGGEAMPLSLAESLKASISGRLTNMYGPTETTIWSSTFDIEAGEVISIGRPIANTQCYIVDQNLNAVPAGVPGELVIGGDGVVRGYHDRPELTSERFVSDWKLSEDGIAQRVYRTGDLACHMADGRLMCLGRIDHQVKIRGYRIELGEIEALLLNHDSVRECAVILREDKEGDKRLVAYVRPQYAKHIDVDVLKGHLAAQLPEFMVPAFFVEMAAMPLTPNGKLDRGALPEPIQQKHLNSEAFALPENDWENLVADIWKRALGVTEVGRRDNFFDIGGHSLLVIQVLKELRENEKVNKSIQMTDLFRHTTVEALAQYIASDEDDTPSSQTASSRVAARKAAMSRRRRR